MEPSAPLLSYWGAVQWMLHGADIATEGYQKVSDETITLVYMRIGLPNLDVQYKGQTFKIVNFTHWVVILTGPKQIEDLCKAGEDELSFIEASNEVRRRSLKQVVVGHRD